MLEHLGRGRTSVQGVDMKNRTVTDDQTMLCAHWEPPFCDRPVSSQDLCSNHYRMHWKRRDLPPTFTRRNVGHNIQDADLDKMTGSCFICGPHARIYPTPRGHVVCAYSTGWQGRNRKTGWTAEQYDETLIAQGGLCAICQNPPQGRGKYDTLSADHCHTSMRTRGLLCGWCNTVLGLMNDDPEALRAAANYLE